MTEHTPGPWWIDDLDDEIEIVGNVENAERFGVKGDWTVATVDASETEAETLNPQANARLIAAAPELLEDAQAYREVARNAISDLYAIMMISTSHPQDIYDFALACRKSHWERLEAIDDRAAIAKAKGEK